MLNYWYHRGDGRDIHKSELAASGKDAMPTAEGFIGEKLAN
jgi:hypothetical protein